MPNGKPAGVRCVQLGVDNLCLIFGLAERPAVCGRLRPQLDMCGSNFETAHSYLVELEILTRP